MKKKTVFVCQDCGYESSKWVGRCPECSQWNSLVEEAPALIRPRSRGLTLSSGAKPQRLADVKVTGELRRKTGLSELDQVLGGGIVAGSVVLIGGAPGIGKSTLLLQVCDALSARQSKVLYVSAEESAAQTKLRADRLGKSGRDLYIVCETNLDAVIEHIQKIAPDVVIIDSIQVLYLDEISSAAGSVSQVRECAARLTVLAKHSGMAVFLVGHVTKEGALAGPRVLEHMVDCVLYFEGETHTNFRILRAVKNRFGSTNEIGIFEMTADGLREVCNASEIFLAERPQEISGSVVVATMEGTRPLLVEIQALVSRTNFGLPRRRATGIDVNRALLLTAVLEKRAHLALQTEDIFLNVAGGVKIVEPAADLAVIAAVASGFKELPVSARDVMFGEVGLGGEIRAVTHADIRVSEARKLGFTRVILPQYNLKMANINGPRGSKAAGPELVGVSTVQEALEAVLR